MKKEMQMKCDGEFNERDRGLYEAPVLEVFELEGSDVVVASPVTAFDGQKITGPEQEFGK